MKEEKERDMTEKKGISGFTLKMIAVVTMLIDHIGAVLVESMVSKYNSYVLWNVDMVLRGIGRLAFPLFCFFIVEGFHYTHDRKKYAIRLGIFAIISEVPFDLAFDKTFFAPYDNSVMITLLLGLLAIWSLDTLFKKSAEKFRDSRVKQNLCDIVSIAVVTAAVVLIEELASSDYGAAGVVAIIIIYLLGRHKLIGLGLAVIWLGLTCGHTEFYALVDLIPLYFYHGRQGHRMKYFFYVFYPAHLLVLSFIARGLGL